MLIDKAADVMLDGAGDGELWRRRQHGGFSKFTFNNPVFSLYWLP